MTDQPQRNFDALTINRAVKNQPWKLPYNWGVEKARRDDFGLGHIQGTHITLHAAKTVGQIASVFEALDHRSDGGLTFDERAILRDKAADLMTAAMRLANLYDFDLARAVVERSEEKNGVTLEW